MQSHQKKSCFVGYPFGKLFPIINKIGNFLSLKRHNWSANWQHAFDNVDLESILALSMILNEWRENEVFYKVSHSHLRIHTKQHYALHISQVLALLTKAQNSVNHKVALILVQILNFYYTKFQNIERFIYFGEIIDEMILMAEKYMMHHSVIQDKKNFKEMLNIGQSLVITHNLGSLMDFLGFYDGKILKPSKNSDPTPQSRKQASDVIKHLIEEGCIPQLLSTLIHIKIDFLIFFELHYQKQWNEYKQRNQAIRDKKNGQNKRKREEILQNYPDMIEAGNINFIKQIKNTDQITSSLVYVRNIIRTATKTGTKPKLFFSYLNPLFRYLPLLIISSESQKQQILVFEKIFLPIIEYLTKLYEDKKQHHFFINYKQLSLFGHMDLVRAFRDTSFLDDLEMGVVAYFEQKIQQHKQIQGYEDQYMEIQSYFSLISHLKKKVIKGLENLHQEFKEQLPFVELQERQKLQGIRKQPQNKNSQLEPHEQNSRTITTKNKKLNNGISMKKYNDESQHMAQKKSGPKPKENKFGNIKGGMPGIPEATNEDEEATDAGEEIGSLKLIKNKEKRETRPRKSKKNPDYSESDNSEEDSVSMNLKPLQKKHRSISPLERQSSKSQDKNKIQSGSSRNLSQLPNKSQGNEDMDKRLQKRPQIIRAEQLIAYYQHQSNTFNVRKIFKEHRIEYKLPDMNSPNLFFQHHVYRFPNFINTKTFCNPTPQTLKTDYRKLKLVKNICNPEADYQKKVMRSIFKQNQKISSQIQKLNENHKKKRVTSSEYKSQAKKLQKDIKQIQSRKKENVQFYQKQLRTSWRMTQTTIRQYPLISTTFGQLSIKQLTKFSQEFFFHLLKKQPHIQQSQTNVFNTKLRQRQQMIEQNIEQYTLTKIHELFMAILYEIMHILNSSDRSLEFFYLSFYKKLPAYMQSMVIFYMFEIEQRQSHTYELLFRALFNDNIQATDLVEILTFLIKESKLVSVEMHYMYQKLYEILNQKCIRMIVMIEELLCSEIIPMVKADKSGQERLRFRKQRHQRLEGLKENFYDCFSTLIDLMNLWLCLSYSSVIFEPNLPSFFPNSSKKIPFMYFCNKCAGPQTVEFSSKNLANYQSYMCQFCSNSVLNRFQLNCIELYGLHFTVKGDIQDDIMKSAEKVQKVLQDYEWNVEQMPFNKYKEDQELGYNKMMQMYENNEQKRIKTQQSQQKRKQQKNEQEYIQQDNEQFCYNSSNILICYYQNLAQLMSEALSL